MPSTYRFPEVVLTPGLITFIRPNAYRRWKIDAFAGWQYCSSRLVGNPFAIDACEKNNQQDSEYDRIDRRNEAYIVHDNFLLLSATPYSTTKRPTYLPKDEISHRSNRLSPQLGIARLFSSSQCKINLPTFAILLRCV
jgi:hypothetical protein